MENKDRPILRKLGKNIRRLREEKQLSQLQLAIDSNIPKLQIGCIERAEINTTVLTLKKISKVLDIEIASLLR